MHSPAGCNSHKLIRSIDEAINKMVFIFYPHFCIFYITFIGRRPLTLYRKKCMFTESLHIAPLLHITPTQVYKFLILGLAVATYTFQGKNAIGGNPLALESDERELQQIKQMQQMFLEKLKIHPYPMYPNYGKITRYEEIPMNLPEQRQLRHPGLEGLMVPLPIIENPNYKGSGKLAGKVALITGGDSGIGAAVAIAFAK